MPLFGGDGTGRFAVLRSGFGGLRFGRLLRASHFLGLDGRGITLVPITAVPQQN